MEVKNNKNIRKINLKQKMLLKDMKAIKMKLLKANICFLGMDVTVIETGGTLKYKEWFIGYTMHLRKWEKGFNFIF